MRQQHPQVAHRIPERRQRYQSRSAEMATTLGVLAREVEKFYDKNSKFKETVTQLTGYIRAHSECVKEKVAGVRAGRAPA